MISIGIPRTRGDLLAAPLPGIRRGVTRANAAAVNIAKGQVAAENMIELTQAQTMVKANAAYVSVADDLLGTLLDTTA